jgi:hypothetical protein
MGDYTVLSATTAAAATITTQEPSMIIPAAVTLLLAFLVFRWITASRLRVYSPRCGLMPAGRKRYMLTRSRSAHSTAAAAKSHLCAQSHSGPSGSAGSYAR